ncbi:fimbria/pilus periplasmic chaperone [Klebsiella aerogenes]
MKYHSIISFLSIFVVSSCYASNGIMLGATRIIYSADAEQSTISIKNKSDKMDYLMQSWVSDGNGKKSSDFFVTPPLFVSHPGDENSLRIELVGKPDWPVDREYLYYFNVKAVPSTTINKNAKNVLQFATQSVIKMFIRPRNLPSSPVDAPASLHCSVNGNNITINNPSPYYVSMVNLKIGKEGIKSEMVAPKSVATVKTSKPENGERLQFQTINDYGAVTHPQICS